MSSQFCCFHCIKLLSGIKILPSESWIKRKFGFSSINIEKNVAPEYLEDKISAFEEVAECLVVPKKIRNSTVICAKVFFKENTRDSEIQFQENLKTLNESLPGYMRITDYEIMSEEFEKNSSRKIILTSIKETQLVFLQSGLRPRTHPLRTQEDLVS